MKVNISHPLAIHEAGARSLNEDFIFPIHNQANTEERLFVVCDGEGGPNAGEVAAKLVALSFAKYFASSPPKGNVTQVYLDAALQTAEEALSAYKESHPESLGMSTTLALLHVGDEQVTIGWVGNTHIYHFEKKSQTLNAPSQEKGDPKALITGKENPQSLFVRTYPVQTLRSGDLFFMATDGISEHLDNETLQALFGAGDENGLGSVIAEISSKAEGIAQDNYSAYLIRIDQLAADASVSEEPGAAAGADTSPEPAAGSGNFIRNAFMGLIVVIILGLIGVLIWTSNSDPYKNAMAGGQKEFEAGNFEAAIDSFSSAYSVPDISAEEKAMATEKIRKAEAAIASEEGLNPNKDAEFYTRNAKGFLAQGNFIDAIRSWEKAVITAPNYPGGDSLLATLRKDMAEAYLHAGIDAFQYSDQNQESGDMARDYFAKGLELNNTLPDSSKLTDDLLTKANDRLSLLSVQDGEQNQLASGQTQSRGLSPEASPSSDEGANARKAATQSRSVQPETGATQQTRSNARLAPTRSALDGPSLSAEEKGVLNKNLATGKRLFTQAKDAESAFLYRTSAEKLEASGPMIDGAGAYLLSFLYHSGKGVNKDDQKALRYAQLSARKNWPAGQYYYAYLLLERQNPRDTLTAIQSLQAAANQNYLDAERLLQTLR